MKGTLALFVGNKSAFSVQRLISNISWMVSDHFNLHLVTAFQDPNKLDAEGFEKVYYGKNRDRLHPYSSEYKSLDEYLSQHDPDAIVQLTEPPRHGTLASLASKKHGTKFVYRYSGDRFSIYEYESNTKSKIKTYAVNNIAGRIPLPLADYHIVLGDDGRNKLVSRGVSESTICELPVSIDIDRFSTPPNIRPPVADSIPSGRQVILFAGWMSTMKGAKTVERVIPKILAQRKDIHFVHVGPGSFPDVPERFQNYVTSVGSVEPELMPQYYHFADLLLHPSNIEGMTRVIMEAIAAGTPVLARDVGEISMLTANTFENEEELIRYVIDMESMPVEDITPFSREKLKEKYIETFTRICMDRL